jgi:hypothetical protein
VRYCDAAAVSTLGKLGTIAAIIGLVAVVSCGANRLRRTPDHGPVVFELWAVTIVAIGYCCFPSKAAYTIGAVPFLLLLLGRALSPTWLAVTALAIVSESFVTPQITKPRLDAGRVFAERALRVSDEAAIRELRRARPRSRRARGRTPGRQSADARGHLARADRRGVGAVPAANRRGAVSRDGRPRVRPVPSSRATATSLATAGFRVVVDSTLRR